MKFKLMTYIYCFTILNVTVAVGVNNKKEAVQEHVKYQFLNYPEIDNTIRNFQQRFTELNNRRMNFAAKMSKLREELISLQNSADAEDIKRTEEIKVLFKENIVKLLPLTNKLRAYSQFLEPMKKLKREIIFDQNFLRRNIVDTLKQGLLYDLYKEVSFYKKLQEDPGLRIRHDVSQSDAQFSEFIKKCDKKMKDLRRKGYSSFYKKGQDIMFFQDEMDKVAVKSRQRLKYLIESVPEINKCSIAYNSIKLKIKEDSYTQEELSSNTVEELRKIYNKRLRATPHPGTLARELDQEYRDNEISFSNLCKKRDKLLYKTWSSEKGETFIEYCKWLVLKSKRVARHRLMQYKQRLLERRSHPKRVEQQKNNNSHHQHGPNCKH